MGGMPVLNRTEDLKMSKSAKRQSTNSPTAPVPPTRQPLGDPKSKKPDRTSKQSHVIAMVQSSKGATIAAMMKATGGKYRDLSLRLAISAHLPTGLSAERTGSQGRWRRERDSNSRYGPKQATRLSRKDWHFGAIGALLCLLRECSWRSGIPPRRLIGFCGASAVQPHGLRLTEGDPDAKGGKEADYEEIGCIIE